MAEIVLVTGGCRSGKSGYAQRLAESLPPTRLFVATCPVTDDEMRRRIEQHRLARADRGWQTVEEQCDLANVLRANGHHQVALVDCISLWVNNLMFHADREKGDSPHLCAAPYGPFRQMGTVPFSGRGLAEADVAQECGSVLDAAEAVRGTVIFVTNEVGLGVVPENALARRYRDLLGRANQTIAARAGTVTLLCCGIPLHLKVKT